VLQIEEHDRFGDGHAELGARAARHPHLSAPSDVAALPVVPASALKKRAPSM